MKKPWISKKSEEYEETQAKIIFLMNQRSMKEHVSINKQKSIEKRNQVYIFKRAELY